MKTTDKLARALAAAQSADIPATSSKTVSTQASVGRGAVNLAFLVKDDLVKAEDRAKAALAELGKPVEMSVDKLVVVPMRKRQLSVEERNLLKASIAAEGIIEPVRVRPAPAPGYFEVTSGANRTEIAIELGLRSIPIVIVADGDNDVERRAFFANLYHATLPDYEKFSGFARELSNEGMTQAKLAEITGIPASSLSKLLSFEKLPAQLLGVVASRRHDISVKSVLALLSGIKLGVGEGELVALLSNPSFEPSENSIQRAIKQLATSEKKEQKEAAKVSRYSGSKGGIIKVSVSSKDVVVRVADSIDARWISQELVKLLAERFKPEI